LPISSPNCPISAKPSQRPALQFHIGNLEAGIGIYVSLLYILSMVIYLQIKYSS
jgi:hypothetical protein